MAFADEPGGDGTSYMPSRLMCSLERGCFA
jgi:hypothetical protein